MALTRLAEDQWLESEKWAWQEILAGRVADFNAGKFDDDEVLDPTSLEGWGEERRLRSDFLTQILLREPHRGEIPPEGVRISGAWFDEAVEIAHVRIAHQLWFKACRFEESANFAGVHIDGRLSLDFCAFADLGEETASLTLDEARVRGEVSIVGARLVRARFLVGEIAGRLDLDRSEFHSLDLTGIKVAGILGLSEVVAHGTLGMNGAQIGQHLFIRDNCRLQTVDAINANVKGQLAIDDAVFDGPLDISGLEVAQGLLMNGDNRYQDIDLGNACIHGQLNLDGAVVSGELNMYNLAVGQQLFMRGSSFEKGADLSNAQIRGRMQLEGSSFGDELDLSGLQAAQDLLMHGEASFEDVDFSTAKIRGKLVLDGSNFAGMLNMNSLEVSESLRMGAGAKLQDVNLIGADIGGQLNMQGVRVEGSLEMNGIHVSEGVFMNEDAQFKAVDMSTARFDGQLGLDGAVLDGDLEMSGVRIGGNLFLQNLQMEHVVDLTGARIRGQLNLCNSKFEGTLLMEGITVEDNVFFRESTCEADVVLIFARIIKNLDLSGTTLRKLDLSGARIEGELRLGSNQHERTDWEESDDLPLNLRNVHVGAFQDRRDRIARKPRESWADSWPSKLQLKGFTYDYLGGFGGRHDAARGSGSDIDVDMQARRISWYVKWLARDTSYNPQPYEQLAAVFRASGDPRKANRVLYESRRRARGEARRKRDFLRWIGSLMLDCTIGYGLGGRYFYSLIWVALFTFVGALVLRAADANVAGLAHAWPAQLVYSLDQLLPIVEFEKYDQVVLPGAVSYYFYAQKLIGWALGSFLVAGFAGLTQKQ